MSNKNNKNYILETLMDLDNEKAKAALENFASNLRKEIQNSEDNDEIYESLELLDNFIFKVPDIGISIIKHILSKKKEIEPNVRKTKFGNFTGKTFEDLVLKTIDILEKLRYIKPDEIFDFMVSFSRHENSKVSSRAMEVLEKQARYNYHILTNKNVGYGVQKKLLDNISDWSVQKIWRNIDVFLLVAGELLSPGFEGTSAKDENTITFHRGALTPTDFLKNLRKKTITLLFDVYKKTNKQDYKFKILNIIQRTGEVPHSGSNEDIRKMIAEDVRRITKEYRNIIFDGKNNIQVDISELFKIQNQLEWLRRVHGDQVADIEAVLISIEKDEFYKKFRVLVGDDLDYRKGKESLDEIRKSRKKDEDSLFNSITKDNWYDWLQDLDKMSSTAEVIDNYKFRNFRKFIKRIAIEKPKIANKILSKLFSYKKIHDLEYFVSSFLSGFKNSEKKDLWSKFVDKAVSRKNLKVVFEVIDSLWVPGDKRDELINREDIEMIEDIAGMKGEFSFLKEYKDDLLLHRKIFETASYLFKIDPDKMEDIIRNELNNFPDFAHYHIRGFDFRVHRGDVDLSKLSKSTIDLIIEIIISEDRLDHGYQSLLWELAKVNVNYVIRVLEGRLNRDSKKSDKFEVSSYSAIPSHINGKLIEVLSESEEYEKWIEKKLENIKSGENNYVYKMELSRLLRRIGGPFKEKFLNSVKDADDKELRELSDMLTDVVKINFDFCKPFIKETRDEKVWSKVKSALLSTGVVKGEYGIAEVYESRSNELEKYESSNNKNVRDFSKNFKEELIKRVKKERERAEEEKQLRKIEFDS